MPLSVKANSGGILESVDGYRKVEAIVRKKVAAMASRANSLPGDYVQEQASLENDCLESVKQHSLLLHNLRKEIGSSAPCTSEANKLANRCFSELNSFAIIKRSSSSLSDHFRMADTTC